VSGCEEDAEAAGGCDACDTSLLVDEGWGSSQHSAGDGCGPSRGERVIRVGGSSSDILFGRDFVEYHGGGVGDSWPTTRGFVVIVVGHRRVWEGRAMGGIRSIVRRVEGVYHSKTDDQASRGQEKRERTWLQSRLSLYQEVGGCDSWHQRHRT